MTTVGGHVRGGAGSRVLEPSHWATFEETAPPPPPPPTVTAVAPAQLPLAGGALTITGEHLTGAVVTVGVAQAVVTSATDEQLVVTAPAGVAGVATVTVTTPGGSATTTVVYTAAPVLASLSPPMVGVAGIVTITLVGSHFSGAGAVTVHFGAATAAGTVVDDAHVTAVAPAHTAGLVPVSLTNALGTSNEINISYIPTAAKGIIHGFGDRGPTP